MNHWALCIRMLFTRGEKFSLEAFLLETLFCSFPHCCFFLHFTCRFRSACRLHASTCRGRGVVRFVDLRKISVGSNTPHYVILLPFPYSCYALDMIIIITLLSPKCFTLQDEFELFLRVRIEHRKTLSSIFWLLCNFEY